MSAFICSDKHIAIVAYYVADYFSIDFQELANKLKSINIESVNFRYGEKTRKTKCNIKMIDKTLSHDDIAKLINCLDYQSCEKNTPDFNAYRELMHKWTKLMSANPDNGKYWTI